MRADGAHESARLDFTLRRFRGDPAARHEISPSHFAKTERDQERMLLHRAQTELESSHRLWKAISSA